MDEQNYYSVQNATSDQAGIELEVINVADEERTVFTIQLPLKSKHAGVRQAARLLLSTIMLRNKYPKMNDVRELKGFDVWESDMILAEGLAVIEAQYNA